jgi:hypothetical protein
VSPSASTAARVKTPKPGHKHKKGHSAAASPSASASATPSTPASASADTGLTTDPLWDHKSRTWIKDMASMVLLGIFFSLIAWWRLIRLSPGRRK